VRAIDSVNPFGLSGRAALITGGGSGIGRATVLAMSKAGARVAVIDLDEEAGQQTVGLIRELGGTGFFARADVSVPRAVDAAVSLSIAELGPIDVLVNNAFVGCHIRPEELSYEDWQRVLGVNLTGYFLCAQAVGLHMIQEARGGAIVNIGSIAGVSALGRGNFAYSVSKGGIAALTRELAIEWAPYGIRVNALLPCQVSTPAIQGMLDEAGPAAHELHRQFLSGIPLGRLAEPEEIALGAVFLASQAASMVTGALLPIDGGNLALNAGGTIGTGITRNTVQKGGTRG
jgi:NAD(P)-dependent dehydrogenase (short-subunit alcohol dehydrogenase family)